MKKNKPTKKKAKKRGLSNDSRKNSKKRYLEVIDDDGAVASEVGVPGLLGHDFVVAPVRLYRLHVGLRLRSHQ